MKKDKKISMHFYCMFVNSDDMYTSTCIPAFAQDSKQHIQYYEDGSYTIETLTIDNLSKSVSFYLHARLSAGYFRSRDRQKSNFPIK